MPSLTTVYRTIVMVASGVIIVKGWQYCGPSAAQIQAIAKRAAEIGQETWSGGHFPGSSGRTAPIAFDSNPRDVVSQQQALPAGSPENNGVSRALPGTVASDTQFVLPSVPAPPMFSQAAPSAGSLASGTQNSSNLAVTDSSALTMLLTRLAELGGVDPALEPWGTSGNLYRFRCRATLADTPQITRHFEAVAAEQHVAVENVVAKIQTWRAERARGQH
jgi:hypothetical protein